MTQPQTNLIAFTPRPFGRYYLIDKMAIGGMAEVFNAIIFGIHSFEMPLVIKRILPTLSDNQKFVDMFVKKKKIYVALQHQNIVQIYDFNKFQNQYFIALEFVEGRDLKNLLNITKERQNSLSIEQSLFIAHQICNGLEYVHTRRGSSGDELGLVHRDLSPANILLSYTGEVKIADFGIAKAKRHAAISDVGVLKGKYKYMSPEQGRGEDIDHRSDIFAVGILLYEMVTGTKVFDGESDKVILNRVQHSIIEEPRRRNPRISPRLNKIICRALHPSPNGRFQTAKNLQEALAGEMHPYTTGALSRQLSDLMNQNFEHEKSADRLRRKRNRDQAFEIHEQDFEDLNLDLEILEDIEPESQVHLEELKWQDTAEQETILRKRYQFTCIFLVCAIVLLLIIQ